MGHLEIPNVHTASVHTCSFVQFEFPHLHSPAWHISPGAHATFLQGSLERVGWKNFEMFDIIGCIENYSFSVFLNISIYAHYLPFPCKSFVNLIQDCQVEYMLHYRQCGKVDFLSIALFAFLVQRMPIYTRC